MRRSNKKVKSERINTLRKQYDAFLEEDKQRKDRNCFILERLDKMCFNSAVVPLQNRRNIFYSNRQRQICSPTDKQIENFPDYNTQLSHHVTPEIPKEIIDESFMIQEISKKYILIPKINTTPLSNHTSIIKGVNNDDSEWMHKYEILNQLKKNELDNQLKRCEKDYSSETTTINDELENINKHIVNSQDKYNIQKDVKQNNSKEDLKTEITREDGTKGLRNFEYNETFEEVKKIPVLATSDQNEPNRSNPDDSNFENTDIERNVHSDDIPANNILYEKIEYDNSKNSILNQSEVCSNINNGYTEINSKFLKSNEPTILSQEHTNEQENKFKSIQNEKDGINALPEIKPNDSVTEISHDIHSENLKREHDAKYPVEMINVPEIEPKNNIKLQGNDNINSEEYINLKTVDSSYPNNLEDFTTQGAIDSNPEHEIQAEDAVENSHNPDITSGIEEFDAEQREMFYSEQAEENYELDQSNIAGTYNQDYDANNVNYQQNTEYYEGNQMEQVYPVEINEHEETLQRYDQNYEEQYSTYEQEKHEQQEYEDPQQYEQLPQNLQPQIDDIIQPEVDQLQYEQHNYETQAYVEGQLDREQGLIENQIVDEMTVENLQIEEQPEKVVD